MPLYAVTRFLFFFIFHFSSFQLTREKVIQPLKMVTSDNMDLILPMTCALLMSHLDDAEYMIHRFKSEDIIASYLKNIHNESSTRMFEYLY